MATKYIRKTTTIYRKSERQILKELGLKPKFQMPKPSTHGITESIRNDQFQIEFGSVKNNVASALWLSLKAHVTTEDQPDTRLESGIRRLILKAIRRKGMSILSERGIIASADIAQGQLSTNKTTFLEIQIALPLNDVYWVRGLKGAMTELSEGIIKEITTSLPGLQFHKKKMKKPRHNP